MMLSGNLATRSPRPTNDVPGVLTLGRTRGVAEHFRALIAKHVHTDMALEAGSYTSSFNNELSGPYRAIFIIIDTPQALEDNLALIESLRSDNLKPIICAVITGRGAFNKIKYFLAGADFCIKLNTVSDEGDELLGEFFNSEEWQRDINLTLDPTRICLLGSPRQKLDISFAEMKILEAFAQTSNHILSHDEIASIMGLNTHFYDPRALEKSISRLRGKIKDMYGTNAIQSIRGYGYRLMRGLISTA